MLRATLLDHCPWSLPLCTMDFGPIGSDEFSPRATPSEAAEDRSEPELVEGAQVAAGKASAAKPPVTVSFESENSDVRAVLSSQAVFDAWARVNRQTLPPMPWNVGIFSDPFKPKLKKPRLVPPFIGMQAALTSTSSGSKPSAADSAVKPAQWDFAKRRLRIARLISTSDHARWEALRKIKTLVLINPRASELGSVLAANAALLKTDEQLGSSLVDCFAAKATGTLVKRAGSLWRFAKFCSSNGIVDPLSSGEVILYEYMQFLKTCGSPTTAHEFVQAWRFLHHAAGLKGQPLDLQISARVRGAADGMFSQKRKLQQASPLTARMVLALENIVLGAPYTHWQLIAGHFLLCLGSCSRFADSLALDSLVLEEHDGLYLLEAAETRYKTATTRERKARLLPIISLGQFLGSSPWAPEWIKMRHEAGFGNNPSLPAWSEITSSWLTRPMTTGEAGLFLREFLVGSKFDQASLQNVGTHSLKSTLLSWAAKGDYLSLTDRRIMGHHLDPSCNSAITYSRDELSRLMVRVYHMLQDIKTGSFRPDDNRAQRIARQVNVSTGEPQFLESEPDSDDCTSEDLARDDMGLEPDRMIFDDLPLEAVARSLVHSYSGVLHVLNAEETHFICGRMKTKNYEHVKQTCFATDIPVCIQCAKSLPS